MSLANFDCLKQLYFCRKCLTTNSCLTFTFFYCSLEAQKIFLLFHCQSAALPLPEFCSSIAKFLLFHCHTSALPLPTGCSSIATFLLTQRQMATLYLLLLLIYPPLCSSIANWLVFVQRELEFCSSIAKFLLFHCHTSALPLPNGCSSIATFLLFHCQLATFYPSIATFLPHLSGIPMPLFGSSIANWLVFALPLKGEGAITNQLRLNPSFWEPSRWGSRGSHVRGGGVRGLKTNVFAASQKRGCARESERGRGKATNSPKKCPWKIQIFAKSGIHGNFFLHGKANQTWISG